MAFRGKHILLVDDSDSLRSKFSKLITKSGAKVSDYKEATDALKHLKEKEFDLIVLDVMMPGFDGLDLYSQIRTDLMDAKTPVLFFTGLFEPRQVDFLNFGETGNSRVLNKATPITDVFSTMAEMMHS